VKKRFVLERAQYHMPTLRPPSSGGYADRRMCGVLPLPRAWCNQAGSEPSMTNDEITARILRLDALVEKDEASRTVLSTNERIAVALVLDRKVWLDQMSWALLAAIDRFGE